MAGLAGSGNIEARDWDPPVRLLFSVNLQKGSYLAAQAQGPFPLDVNIKRSRLGPARTG